MTPHLEPAHGDIVTDAHHDLGTIDLIARHEPTATRCVRVQFSGHRKFFEFDELEWKRDHWIVSAPR